MSAKNLIVKCGNFNGQRDALFVMSPETLKFATALKPSVSVKGFNFDVLGTVEKRNYITSTIVDSNGVKYGVLDDNSLIPRGKSVDGQ